MNFDHEEEKLESYLRQFRAQSPRPLPGRKKHTLFRSPVLIFAAAAAVIVLALVFSVRHHRPTNPRDAELAAKTVPVAQEISLIRLSRIAQQEPEKLGSHLDELSTQLLPDVHESRGVLKYLARE